MAENTPTAQQVAEALGEPGAWKGEPRRWDEAMAACPAGPLPFLATAKLAERCRAAGIAGDRVPLLVSVADEIAKDSSLRAFAWYMHWRVFVKPQGAGQWFAPSLGPRLGTRAGQFFLLLGLDFPERLASWHRKLGYPHEVTVETIQQIACYEAMHVTGEGVPGIYDGFYEWLSAYLFDPFVRLGRLEYRMCGWDGGVGVFRRDTDGAVAALAEDGAMVGDDGLLLGEEAPQTSGWTAKRGETAEAFTGFLIDPAGRIVRREVRLPRPEWKRALAEGDTVLDLHIPWGGGMDWERVRDSLKLATAFFPRHHPDRPVRMLVLATTCWFMDPQVPEVLGGESNPARFQRACYLHPCEPDPDSLGFVLGWNYVEKPLDELPVRTSVQRALVGFLKRGGIWHGGSMFMLPEDMADPRESVYRGRFAALSRELGPT